MWQWPYIASQTLGGCSSTRSPCLETPLDTVPVERQHKEINLNVGLVVMVVNNENLHLINFKEPRIKTSFHNGNGGHEVKVHNARLKKESRAKNFRVPVYTLSLLRLSTITDIVTQSSPWAIFIINTSSQVQCYYL
jgi:hypothetical protein